MKLLNLTITNFRGLKGSENVIDFSNSNIIFLIGQNNIGKSSFLRAYEFFTAPKQVANREDFYNHDISIPIEIEGHFLKEPNDDEDTDLKGKSKEPDWLNKWTDSYSVIKIKKVWNKENSIFQKYTYDPNNGWVEGGFGGIDTLFTKYAPTPIAISAMENQTTLEDKVNKLIQDDFIKKVRDDHPEKFTALIDGVKELQALITGSDAINTINTDLNEHFSKVFADLTLKILPTKDENIKLEDAFKKNHSIIVEKINSERKETFLQNGHGVIRQALFNFITFLKREGTGNRKEYIILFEEPELFLHPKVAFKLRESLYNLAENSPYQILCATHSPLMIDISKPHSSLIRVTKNDDETTHTFQVGEKLFGGTDELKQWVQMVNRFNPHICEAFYADKVLLVEGDTETIVYRDLISRFYSDTELFVLNTGSKTNIPFFQTVLTSFDIEHYIIHDTDSRKTTTNSRNPAWALNLSIWSLVNTANDKKPGLARRYVHKGNFEQAHNIVLSGNKDKPLEAYRYAKSIDPDSDAPCLEWLKDILGDKIIMHDDNYVESLFPQEP